MNMTPLAIALTLAGCVVLYGMVWAKARNFRECERCGSMLDENGLCERCSG